MKKLISLAAITVASLFISWTAPETSIIYGKDSTIFFVSGDYELSKILTGFNIASKADQLTFMRNDVGIEGINGQLSITIQEGTIEGPLQDIGGPGVSWTFTPFTTQLEKSAKLAKKQLKPSLSITVKRNTTPLSVEESRVFKSYMDGF